MESGRSVICMPSCSGCMSIPAVPDNCQSFEQKVNVLLVQIWWNKVGSYSLKAMALVLKKG